MAECRRLSNHWADNFGIFMVDQIKWNWFGTKSLDTPTDPAVKLVRTGVKPQTNPDDIDWRLAGGLVCLTTALLDITLATSFVSRCMQACKKPLPDAVIRVLRHLRDTLDLGILFKLKTFVEVYNCRCMFLEGNLVTWRSKITICNGKI